MPLTPADVANKHFRVVRQPFGGYNEDEVDTFLDEVEAEISRLLSENAALHSELEQARRARGEGAGPAEATGEGGEQAALRTLLLAQRTADEAVAQARTEAEALLASAREEAAALQRQSRERYDAALGPLEERRRELERHLDSLVEFETDFRNRLRVYLQSRLAELDHPTVEALPTLPARPPGPDEPGLGEPAPGEPGLGEGSGEPEEWLDVPEAGPAPGPEPGGGEVDTPGPGGAHPVGGSPFAPGPPPAGR